MQPTPWFNTNSELNTITVRLGSKNTSRYICRLIISSSLLVGSLFDHILKGRAPKFVLCSDISCILQEILLICCRLGIFRKHAIFRIWPIWVFRKIIFLEFADIEFLLIVTKFEISWRANAQALSTTQYLCIVHVNNRADNKWSNGWQ